MPGLRSNIVLLLILVITSGIFLFGCAGEQEGSESTEAECTYVNGKGYSSIKGVCIDLSDLELRLDPLKDGAKAEGDPGHGPV